MKTKQNPRDEQAPQTGKVANDRNKVGEQELTQKSQARPGVRLKASQTVRRILAVVTRRNPAVALRAARKQVVGCGVWGEHHASDNL